MSYPKNVKNIHCFGGWRMWWRQLWLRFCYVVTLGRYPRLYTTEFITVWNDLPFPEYGYFIYFKRVAVEEDSPASTASDQSQCPQILAAENEGMP